MSERSVSTLIIGAGAAGLAAGRILHDNGHDILILEARNRIGGRIWTDHTLASFPIERGAEFIHGEQVVTHQFLRSAGLIALPTPRKRTLFWSDGGIAMPRVRWSEATQQLIGALDAAYATLAHADFSQADQSLATYLHQHGFAGDALNVADVLLAQTCCASLETLSCADLQREMRVDHAGLEEFRIEQGYGALLDWLQRDLPIPLNTPVQTVRWGKDGVDVLTAQDRVHAERCILTVPVALLQTNLIRFDPPLNSAKMQAIYAFRSEPATKLIYRFAQPLWDPGLVMLAHRGLAARWWTPGYGRADANVITAYITAARASQIDAMSEQAALQCGLEELEILLGVNHLQGQLTYAERVCWASDPWARGGYAHIPPGAAQARLELAKPEGNVLFFAGEATAYDTNPQTVHGAIESGWRAAGEIMRLDR